MESNVFVPVSALVETLALICQEAQTGYLHFMSSDNHAGTIMVEGGQIVSVRYFVKTGEAALDVIGQLELVQYRFSEGSIPEHIKDKALSQTPMILERLGLSSDSEARTVPNLWAEIESLPDIPGWDPGSEMKPFQDQLEGILLHLIGPFAPFLIKQAAAQVSSPHQLVDLIMAELPVDQQERFRQQVTPWLNNHSRLERKH